MVILRTRKDKFMKLWNYRLGRKEYMSIGGSETAKCKDNTVTKLQRLNKKHFHKKQRQLANKINEIIDKLNEV